MADRAAETLERPPAGGGLRSSGTTRPGRLVWVLISSIGVLIATPIVWWETRPPIEVGATPSFGPQRDVRGSIGPPGLSEGSALGPEVPDIEVSSARLSEQRPLRPGPQPVRLSIPAIGVVAPIIRVGVEVSTGRMEVPADISTVGWYRFGPAPGAAGSSLLVGHVSGTGGLGVFFRLREMEPGDVLQVRFAGGRGRAFTVVGRRSYDKDRVPPAIFIRRGDPVITLITCGGAFDPATGHYVDNVMVFAVPRS